MACGSLGGTKRLILTTRLRMPSNADAQNNFHGVSHWLSTDVPPA